MELNSILKVQIKNLWKVFLVFCAFWIVVSLILLIPNTMSKVVYDLIFSSFIVISCTFLIAVAIEIYGNYGKTFIFIQNNRVNYIISGIIWNIITSLILTLLMFVLKVCSNTVSVVDVNNEIPETLITFRYFGMLFLGYVFFFNVGTIYSVFFQYHKKLKKGLIIFLLVVFLLFGYFTLPFVIKIMGIFINFTSKSILPLYFVITGVIDILILVITSVYYCKQNILKAYPNE